MFKNLSISRRLTAAFSINVVMLLIVAVVAVAKMATMDTNTQLIVSDLNNKILEFHGLKDRAANIAVVLRDIVMSEDASQLDARLARIDELNAANLKSIAGMATIFYTEKGKALYKTLTEASTEYGKQLEVIKGLVRSGNYAQAKTELLGPVQKAQLAFFSPLDDLMGVGKAVSAKEAADANAAYVSARLWLLIALLASVAISVVSAVAIVRSVTRPVHAAARGAAALASGDLTHRVNAGRGDEIGQMANALDTAVEQLAHLVRNIQAASGAIDNAAREIAQGNTDLSQRTEEQAASLEQTAASMEELTSTVRQNVEHAMQARRLSQEASGVADAGSQSVRAVVETMQAMASASARMSDMIKAIEGIAFQTNILALNAAVEAARAGEQGRGFAVVAGEVRTLAQRSAGTAKDIRELIAASIQQVEDGTSRVEVAGRTMDQIVVSVRRVNELIAEIAAASDEQARGIEQVNQAVTQMDQVTQQNAALVEEAAAAAEHMRQQAADLVGETAKFRVDADSSLPHGEARHAPTLTALAGTPWHAGKGPEGLTGARGGQRAAA
ncbi:methyl-accepting chemotaxis protein [Pandoraea apista]|uniref:HAMP domain-containing protein n=1 Tax=Pandoraea apista TaxID=93218 RepID=A0A5E5P651_9BURK|nr:methyl-accepting chemotaxis protein [Pandoraea apista]AJF00017.1 histidine kinase [Pandoraea apista]AKH74169.1 histidine kinase [Pandoraea apista]AKI62718.1 histidine kinase [Pandoraea apista]AVF41015.1 HAMP domain-containing protein [Pandoraea apista]OXS88629.1 methyl-accepting chemotaxis protein [Pandoraea apista]